MKVILSAFLLLSALSFSNEAMAQKTAKASTGTSRTVEGTLKRKLIKTHAQSAPCMKDYAQNDYFYVILGTGEKETFLNVKPIKAMNFEAMVEKKVRVTGTVHGKKVSEAGKDYNCIVLDVKTMHLVK